MTVPSTVLAGTAASAEGVVRCDCTAITTTRATRTTTAATMPPSTVRRRRAARARAAASAARRAARRSRLLRPREVSVGTGVLLEVGFGQPATERQARGGSPREGEDDDEQGEVAENLGRVGDLPRGDLAAVAEAAAIDLQAARPGRADTDEEDGQQDGGGDRGR